ncbi:hypothetical protein UFOVP239_7 [uncultured Caudovirales phage]|uniref:Uncharacterized protein n=1 Tax=uncultured Caudovirales phage TaxID=2100421 RepID=A0A6J7WPE4_9CAUD|nr:hypothetical protein UFOVP239_7 [uncultured Caudovirales phage]
MAALTQPGGSMPTLAQMKLALSRGPTSIQNVGVNEAPGMQTKTYIPPASGDGVAPPAGGVQTPSGMPIGGIDTNQAQAGQQFMPQPLAQQQAGQPPQPGQPGQPGMPGQPGQQQPPQMGAQQPTPPAGNMLQMTQQGRALGAMGPAAGQQPQGMAEGGRASYQNAPKSLMGYKREGPQTPFHESKYPFVQYLRVHHGQNSHIDAMKGMNKPHALARAELNWPAATHIEPIGEEDALKHDPLTVKAVKGMAKGGDVKESMHYAPAPSLSKAEIEEYAERMTRQMSGLDNPNSKTLQQLAREQSLPVKIKGSKKMDVPIINYEQLKGASSVGVPGDTSRGGVKPSRRSAMAPVKAGEYLHAIGEEKLDSPVPLYGGKDYGAFGHPEGWASDLGASAGMFNVVKKLAAENPEGDVYGHYHKMSPEALNHALHMLDSVLSYHKPHASSAERIAMLNDLMRNKATTTSKHDVPYPEFPGFEKPEDIMLQGAMNSGMRKKIIGLLGKEKYFPGGKQKIDDIIYAISHPELRNIETGAGGSSIIKFDPKRELRESVSPHPTYGYDIPSRLVGKTKYITPARILAPRSIHNAEQEIKAMGKKVIPFNMAKMNIIREPIDEQFINQIGEYEQAMKKRLGYKQGGKVQDQLSTDTMRAALILKKKAK